jgi:hypothetical protein
MKLSKLLFAAAVATALFSMLVGSASARNISFSHQSLRATWTRMDYTGGFGTVECEVVISGTVHTRTFAKVVNSLVGYMTSATVNRCARGGASILRETLPWHVTYRGFTGVLPNITSGTVNVIGASWRIRESAFGVTCLSRTTTATPAIGTANVSAGVFQSLTASGTIPCVNGELNFNGTLRGSTSIYSSQEGTTITVTLI